MIDLYEEFRDLLIELHDAGAEFVVLGGYAVASERTRAGPRGREGALGLKDRPSSSPMAHCGR
jgi:hypothetical protein